MISDSQCYIRNIMFNTNKINQIKLIRLYYMKFESKIEYCILYVFLELNCTLRGSEKLKSIMSQ